MWLRAIAFLAIAVVGPLACDGEEDNASEEPIDPIAFHAAYPTCLASAAADTVSDFSEAEDRLGWRPLAANGAFELTEITVSESCDGTLGVTAWYEHPTSNELLFVLEGSGTTTVESAPTGVPMDIGDRNVQWLEGPLDGALAVFRFGEHDDIPLYATVFGYDRAVVEELIRSLD